MKVQISRTRRVKAEPELPSSKSVSNRLLILQALSRALEIDNLSQADDTLEMQACLKNNALSWTTGEGGTTFRFLLAYAAVMRPGQKLYPATPMLNRPVLPLVNALNQLGAHIERAEDQQGVFYQVNKGIKKGGEIEVDATVSSQFISALMMIAPLLEGGLRIRYTKPVSHPYIEMTAWLMQDAGAEVIVNGNSTDIMPGAYSGKLFVVPPDWSSAALWFLTVAGPKGADLQLNSMDFSSLQGDRAILELCCLCGLETYRSGTVLHVLKDQKVEAFSEAMNLANLEAYPDLVPVMAVLAVLEKRKLRIEGLKSLPFKETQRIEVLVQELAKTGAITDGGVDWLSIDACNLRSPDDRICFTSHHDHRMAMAFSFLANYFNEVVIEDPAVVRKSYPAFFQELQKAGYQLDFTD